MIYMKLKGRYLLPILFGSAAVLAVPGVTFATDVGGTGGPGTGHEHPLGGSPLRASLVPAFRPCTVGTSNASHDPSLPGRSCSPPVPASTLVASGPQALAFSRIRVLPVGECAPFDPSHCYPDVTIAGNSTDVHAGSPTGPLFSGSLTGVATLPGGTVGQAIQVTDARNQRDVSSGACTSFNCSATTVPLPFPVPVSCSNGTCSAATTANTLAPGSVIAGRRGVVEIGQFQIQDSSGNIVAIQGVFVP